MTFNLKDVNVIKHRNKPREPCVQDWKNFDQYIITAQRSEGKFPG